MGRTGRTGKVSVLLGRKVMVGSRGEVGESKAGCSICQKKKREKEKEEVEGKESEEGRLTENTEEEEVESKERKEGRNTENTGWGHHTGRSTCDSGRVRRLGRAGRAGEVSQGTVD